jgi:hypothetical protein
MGIAKVSEPLVVYANHLCCSFWIIQAPGRTKNSVEYFALNAIEILVPQSQVRIRQTANTTPAIIIKAGGSHPVGTMNLPGDIEAPRRTHTIHQS